MLLYCHYLNTAAFENTTARVENFQEVTTVNESIHNLAAFSFDLFTRDFNLSIADHDFNNDTFQLQWQSADNSSSGLITLTVTKSHGIKQSNHTTKGAVSYHFTVNATALGEGPLLLKVFAKLQCFRYSGYYCNLNTRSRCTCSRWQYETESKTILISAKKGKSHAHHVHVARAWYILHILLYIFLHIYTSHIYYCQVSMIPIQSYIYIYR